MSPSYHLAAINFFTGDIQGGLGPFLSAWLASTGHWSPERVGFVTTVVGFGGLVMNGAAGLLADHTSHPRILLAIACGVILAGTLLILPAHSTAAVLGSQLLTAAGGALLLPTLTLLTLGMVGKAGFPGQQGRNQAFNHAGIVSAAVLIYATGTLFGAAAPFIVLGAMAFAAIIAVTTTPAASFNGRRAHGWQENEPDHVKHRASIRDLLRNRRLLLLAATLALFNLSSGSMLSLVAQRLVNNGHAANRWTAIYVVAAQLTMIPVALWAGSFCDRRGRRRLLLLACVAQPLRALLCAWVTEPTWLIPMEVLDGISSGLLGVATPVLVADLTWGSGRTQTALGSLYSLQGIGGALSGLFGGLIFDWLGWSGAFYALGAPAVAATVLAFFLQETRTAPIEATATGRGATA